MSNTITYKAEEIFHDIPGDSENVHMTIPPEIMEKMGWKEGDTIRVLSGEKGTIIIEKVEKEASGKEKETK
jgi:AbrB family looped-hinge helix DNA binding protein